MTRTHWLLFLVCLSLLTVPFARAGGHVTGNGGNSVVRRIIDDRIDWVEFLDLYEARHLWPDQVVESDGDFKTIARTALRRLAPLNPRYYAVLSETLEKMFTRAQLGDQELFAHLTDDIGIAGFLMPYTWQQAGAELEQLAIYTTDDRLLLNPELLAHLAPTDVAALYLHEAIYYVGRHFFSETNSLQTQALVGWLFLSTFPDAIRGTQLGWLRSRLHSATDGVSRKAWHCRDRHGLVEFFYFRLRDGKTRRLQFVRYGGHEVLSPIYGDLGTRVERSLEIVTNEEVSFEVKESGGREPLRLRFGSSPENLLEPEWFAVRCE